MGFCGWGIRSVAVFEASCRRRPAALHQVVEAPKILRIEPVGLKQATRLLVIRDGAALHPIELIICKKAVQLMPARTVLPEPEQTGRQQRHRKRQYDKNGSYDSEQQCISLPFCFGVTVIIPYKSPNDKMPAVIKSVTNVTDTVTDGTFPFRGGYDMKASESNISHLKLRRRSGIIGFCERAVTMKRQNMIMYRALRLIFKPLFSVLYRCEIIEIGRAHV